MLTSHMLFVWMLLIPKSHYLSPFENKFQLREDNTTVEITVPVGSYLLSAFKSVISALLTMV